MSHVRRVAGATCHTIASKSTSAPSLGNHLRQNQLAKRWGIAQQTLANWRWQKKGPPHLRIGGRILYRLEDIEQFEAEHLRGNTEAAKQPF